MAWNKGEYKTGGWTNEKYDSICRRMDERVDDTCNNDW